MAMGSESGYNSRLSRCPAWHALVAAANVANHSITEADDRARFLI